MWPELDWAAAREQHGAAARESILAAGQRPTAANEALARCVAATQAAVLYRSLARWSDDPRMRELAAHMAHEETISFARFRGAFEAAARDERLGHIASWRATRAHLCATRDVHVQLAFDALCAHCGKNAPFPVLDYVEFCARMRCVIARYAELRSLERMLFKPWLRAPRVPKALARVTTGSWFRPVLTRSA
jgi:hypothetical protein